DALPKTAAPCFKARFHSGTAYGGRAAPARYRQAELRGRPRRAREDRARARRGPRQTRGFDSRLRARRAAEEALRTEAARGAGEGGKDRDRTGRQARGGTLCPQLAPHREPCRTRRLRWMR